MNNQEKQILKQQLDSVYRLLNKLENSKIKNTTEYKILFELESINLNLDIPFAD